MLRRNSLTVFGLMALFVAGYTLLIMHHISYQVTLEGVEHSQVHRKERAGAHDGAPVAKQQQQNLQQEQQQQLQDGEVVVSKRVYGGDESMDDDGADGERAESIRDALRHAWQGYERFAWGKDELQPVSETGIDNFGGLGAQIVDALDTLWMLGFKDEFQRARDWVASNLDFDKSVKLSLFETNIRIVGGLLAAHDMSGDPIFLNKAVDLADRLLQAFNSTTGIPYNFVRLPRVRTGRTTAAGTASLAELGTFGVEFETLTKRSGRPEFAEVSRRIYNTLNNSNPDAGLLPVRINRRTGRAFSSRVQLTMGAMADSYYEYLLKTWLINDKQDNMYRDMWIRASDDMLDRLLRIVPEGELWYLGELKQGARVRQKDGSIAPGPLTSITRMEELACYVPGNLALGVLTGAVTGTRAARYEAAAMNLTYTCWQMYERMPTGLAPEDIWLNGTSNADSEMVADKKFSILRPETIESLWYLWRLTGDRKYKEWGWKIFEATEKHCKTDAGYTGVKDVTVLPPEHDDEMQSFFLAETLKYLWLLFSPKDTIDFSEWVLNTEAHAMRIRSKPVAENFLPATKRRQR